MQTSNTHLNGDFSREYANSLLIFAEPDALGLLGD
jgi:hypothetical protein